MTLSDDVAEDGKFGLAGVQINEPSNNFLSGLTAANLEELKENISARFLPRHLFKSFQSLICNVSLQTKPLISRATG